MEESDSSSSSSSSSSFDYTGSGEYDDAVDCAVAMAVNLATRAAAEEGEPEPAFRRRVVLVRRRVEAQERLMRDYFVDEPTYNPRQFRRRFRMQKGLFLKICGDLETEYTYFQQRYDASGKLGFTAIQKCTSAVRQLAYGVNSDLLDEYLHMAERTSREALIHFCKGNFLTYVYYFLYNVDVLVVSIICHI